MVIIGSDMLQRPDSDAVYSAVVSIASSGAKPDNREWKTLNILHRVSPGSLIKVMGWFFCGSYKVLSVHVYVVAWSEYIVCECTCSVSNSYCNAHFTNMNSLYLFSDCTN